MAGGSGRTSPSTTRSTGSPVARELATSGQAVEPGRGLAGRGVVRAQHAERRPQLGERLAAGVLDGEQGVAGVVGPLVQHVGADPRLHRDARQGVGDRVVQVAGDPQPLLGDPAAGLLLARLRQVPGPFLQRDQLGPPAEHRAAEHDRAGGPADEQRGEERRRVVEDGCDEHHRRHRGGARDRAGPRRHRQRVDGDDHREGEGDVRVLPEAVERQRRRGHGEHRRRGPAAEGQRTPGGEDQGHGERVERPVVGAVLDDGHGGHEHDDGDRRRGDVDAPQASLHRGHGTTPRPRRASAAARTRPGVGGAREVARRATTRRRHPPTLGA